MSNGTSTDYRDLVVNFGECPEGTRGMPVSDRTIQIPATPYITEWDDDTHPPAPSENEHARLPGLDAARTAALLALMTTSALNLGETP